MLDRFGGNGSSDSWPRLYCQQRKNSALYNICSELLRLSSKQPQAAPSNQTSSYGVREISMMWERMALKL
jgi:hypothetical protein